MYVWGLLEWKSSHSEGNKMTFIQKIESCNQFQMVQDNVMSPETNWTEERTVLLMSVTML